MSIRFVLYSICYLYYGMTSVHAQSIRINEVQASNTIYQDEDQDTPDWIELYNTTGQEIDMEGWSLTDDLDNGTYWRFNNTTLAGFEYQYLWASGKDRKERSITRSLVREDLLFRYTVPSQNLGDDWKNTDYNDSTWDQGLGAFGYGDGDDMTIVPNGTRSIFIRKEFNIADAQNIINLYLDIDYDDGFVAYINGTEVARNNINGNNPSYLSFAITDKEAKMYSGGDPDHFELLDHLDLLRDGENVLAIQVHNNVTSSSDMTLRPFLTARYRNTTEEGADIHPILDYSSAGLHTDFKISSDSETIYLIEPSGDIHDSITIANLPTDISFGHSINGDLAYFDITTPGEANGSVSFQGILDNDIIFSDDGGQVDPLTLALSTGIPFTSIRYTTDATEPRANSQIYNTPINISATTTVRAALFRDGYLPSNISSRNYIIGPNHTIPIMSLITNPINLFDEEEGIYSYGNNFNNELPYFGANFWKDEEKPIHISYYGIDNELKISLNAGVKIFGGWSRAFDQRSLSIFARKKYGPSNIQYPLFEERNYQSYGAVVLRNAGNDNMASNIRDIINHELIKDLDLETQAYQTVATYINDEYWGIYHLREKVNEHFLANKFGVDPDSIDLLEFDADVIHGDNSDYLSMINLATSGNISNPNVYEALEERIDIDNFIDYFATQIYIDNSDWPGNNIKYWKPKNGKWRWILYDTDFGLNLFQEFGHFHNTLNFALEPNGPDWPNPPWSTVLFRALVENQSFRIKLVNRFADFMNSRFSTENIRNTVEQKVDELQPEIVRHYDRWNVSLGNWSNQINRIINFADQRPDLMKSHIRGQFGLPAVHNINITNPESNKGYVKISTLIIKEESWDGDYFEGNPFTIIAIANPGFTFSHWSGSVNSSNESLSIDITNAMTVVPHFEETNITEPTVVINEVNYKSSKESDAGDWIEFYNPSTQDIDLTNWYIKDSNDENIYEIPATILEADQYLIIAANDNKFQSIHPDIEHISELSFGLSSDDQVRLFDATNMIIDSVNYNSFSPWPILANGQGFTLELINPLLDNNLGENYNTLNINGSPGRKNILETNNLNLENIESISIFPNPVSDQLNLLIDAKQNGQLSITILDLMGRKAISKSIQNYNSGSNQFTINVKHLVSGNYQINIKDSNGNKMTKAWIKL